MEENKEGRRKMDKEGTERVRIRKGVGIEIEMQRWGNEKLISSWKYRRPIVG